MRAALIPSTARPVIGVSATSLLFGTLCPGDTKDLVLEVFNTGTADLHVSSITRVSGSPQFALVPGPPIPTTIPPGSHVRYTIRFTPVLPSGSITATFRIASDDPVTPTLDVQTTGSVGGISIDVPPALAFPPTVIQSVGACVSPKPFPISNTGQCGLTIKSITVSGAAAGDYTLIGLPSFPIIL